MRLTRHAIAVLLMLLLQSNSSSSRFLFKPEPVKGNPLPAVAATSPIAAVLYEEWALESAGLSKDAFEKAYKGFMVLQAKNRLNNCSLLTIVDYSLSSVQKRLFVLEMTTGKLLFNTLVAHGRRSGL
ncbi:MAG TPA: hypothetical protein DCQ97_00380 [Chitinophagaceae bacterium]|nr:hypothetical protein [Chitinophagaceae bacterium]